MRLVAAKRQPLRERIPEKIEILENPEGQQVGRDADGHQAPPVHRIFRLGQEASDGEIDGAREEKENGEARIPEAVKDVAGDDDDDNPERQRTADEQIHREEQNEKAEKFVRIEKHRLPGH